MKYVGYTSWIGVESLLLTIDHLLNAGPSYFAKRKAYIKKNKWLDRHDIFDRDQQRQGYVKKNTFVKDRYDIFDQNQRRKGYIKKNDFLQGTYEYFPLDER